MHRSVRHDRLRGTSSRVRNKTFILSPRLSLSLLFILLSLLAILKPEGSIIAQSSKASYWEYSASGRLKDVQLADIDGDGVEDILVSDENSRLVLLGTDGQVVWGVDAASPITAFTFINASPTQTSQPQIALAGEGWLQLLDIQGQEIWQQVDESLAEPIDDMNLAEIASLDYIVKLFSYDVEGDGVDEILSLYKSGRLAAYDTRGREVWQYEPEDAPADGADPLILVSDVDGDGRDEIVLGVFTARRFSELLFLDEGVLQWDQALSRRITNIVQTNFPGLGSGIAVGTNFGQVNLYNASGELIWYRTINRPITALAFDDLAGVDVLAIGTDAGSVITYDSEGRRYWVTNLAQDGNRSIAQLLPTGSQTATGQSGIAVLLDSASAVGESADVLLLGNDGQTLLQLGNTDLPEVTRLVDINHDKHFELLLARFATLQLIGLGVGNSEYVEEWQYSLDAVPSATLLVDLDRDGEDEIIVGTEDGRLHALSSDRSIRWLHATGSAITHLAAIRTPLGTTPRIVVVHHNQPEDDLEEVDEGVVSWLELRSAQGERAWEIEIPAQVLTLTIDESGSTEQPIILVGTDDGQILAYDESGHELWTRQVASSESSIGQILVVRDPM
ncbi:MAG: PQQ-binding-like beta-propeller repeat protein [Chloroflexota bacterium]